MLKLTTWTLGALALVLAVPVAAQDEREGSKRDDTIKELVRQRGSDDLDARERAVDRLTEMGRRAVPHLEEAAKGSADRETKWNARMLLRQFRTRGEGQTREEREEREEHAMQKERGDLGDAISGDLRERLSDLREMQRSLQLELQRLRDGLAAGGGFEFRMPRLQWDSEDGKSLRIFRRDGNTDQHGRSVKTEIRPDGSVRMEVTRREDGEEHSDVYEAESLEAFKEEHPDLAEEVQIETDGPGMTFHFGGKDGAGHVFSFGSPDGEWQLGDVFKRFGRLDGALAGPDAPTAETPLPPAASSASAPDMTNRLGVTVSDVGDEMADEYDLESGEGLLVSNVNPGSLAEALSIKPGDVVMKINGAAVKGAESVRQQLEKVEAGGSVVVEVGRAGDTVMLEAKKPAARAEKKSTRKLEKF